MLIADYRFGEIEIGSGKYRQDIIIHADKVEPWLCSDHHDPNLADFAEVLQEKPDILLIGSGYSELMKVRKSVKQALEKEIPKVLIFNTRKASRVYNKLAAKNKNMIACFHLTC